MIFTPSSPSKVSFPTILHPWQLVLITRPGARAYFMHSVLHDWPDETCLKILANITAAMKPGYSKLLINENVIPDTGAHWETTALDIMMLTLLSSRERTRENWEDLLGKGGLKIEKIWSARNGAESLIECVLA